MHKLLLLFAILLCAVGVQGQITHPKGSLAGPTVVANLPSPGNSNILWDIRDASSATDCTVGGGSTRVVCKWNGSAYAAVGGSGGSGAPTDATYITQTPNASLSNEQAMSALATGIVKNTTATGVQSIIVPGTGVETFLSTPSSANLRAALTDELGTGAALFDGATPTSFVCTNCTGTASININGTVGATTPTTGAFTTGAFSSTITQTSNSASAFVTGPNGATNPVLKVDNSTASQADGVSINGGAQGAGTTFQAIGSGVASPLIFKNKGTANIEFYTNGSPTFYFLDGSWRFGTTLMSSNLIDSNGVFSLQTATAVETLNLGSTRGLAWKSTDSYNGTTDTTISRNAAGVVQIGTSTANASGSLLAANGAFTSSLNTTGANQIVNVASVTSGASYNVVATDYFVCVNKGTGSTTTINLPSSPATGRKLIIKDCKGDANTNNITLTPAAGNIDGAGTYVMNVNRQSVMLVYSGSEWTVN